MIVALRRMDPRKLHPAPPSHRQPGQLRAALRYVAATPSLRLPLAMMAVIGTFSFNFPTLLPLLAKYTFDGSATTLALLTSALAVGSVTGALTMGRREQHRPALPRRRRTGLRRADAARGRSRRPSALMLVALALTGAGQRRASPPAPTRRVQLAADPEMRGRVMALYSIVFIGSTPIGAPIVGWLASAVDPRAGLALGAAAAIGTALVAWGLAFKAPRDATGASDRLGDEPELATASRSSELVHRLVDPLLREGRDLEALDDLVGPAAGSGTGSEEMRPSSTP